MSRTALACWRCGHRLGWRRREGGAIRPDPGVYTVVAPGDPAPVVRLICPGCGYHQLAEGMTLVVLPSLQVDRTAASG